MRIGNFGRFWVGLPVGRPFIIPKPLLMKRTVLLLAAGVCGQLIAQAQPKKAKPTPTQAVVSAGAKTAATTTQGRIKFSEFDLPNGLHVILHQDNSTPLVAVTMMYHVGSKNEQPTRTGFAHFFEHLLFEGSDNIKRGEYMKIVKGNGGQLNANTSQDRTFYYEVMPSNKLELGLYLESERLLHAKIDEKGVETQREVVKEEKRQRIDNQPYGSIFTEVLKHAYTKHPYQWAPIGSLEHLNAATIDEFRQFYKDFYVPNNAILSIAGDIDPAQAKTLVTKYFAEIPKGTKAIYRPSIKEPAQTKEVRDTIYDNITLPAVVQAYHIPAQGTPDSYAMEVLQTILAGGESSRMTKEIVDKQQKALQSAAFPVANEDAGLFLTYSIANQGVKPDELEASVNTEVERVKKDLVTDAELTKVKNQIETNFVNQNARIFGVAENLANYKMYYGDANLINTEIDRYNKVTKEDLRRVANQYLRPENRVVLYYLPKAAEGKDTGKGK
ncbi:putative zinc protease y4wA [Fibrella aestuarina BUZ 2]|uniref:Putative zinc protease y4wA n=1 Tax=Fibrella aestuarina BUZ 2 TaxID=1166018 RepID=I0KG89_9BACT|nr:putative zinc protease y4wA [Fibrella aestuarina BUZ 2]